MTLDLSPTPPAADRGFDILRLDALTPSNEGKRLVLVHPDTGRPFKRADGEALYITLLGRQSQRARVALKRINDAAGEATAAGRLLTTEENEALNTDYLVEITVGWNFTRFGDEDFPCNAENARRLWSEPRLAWLRPRALEFADRVGNFLPSAD